MFIVLEDPFDYCLWAIMRELLLRSGVMEGFISPKDFGPLIRLYVVIRLKLQAQHVGFIRAVHGPIHAHLHGLRPAQYESQPSQRELSSVRKPIEELPQELPELGFIQYLLHHPEPIQLGFLRDVGKFPLVLLQF